MFVLLLQVPTPILSMEMSSKQVRPHSNQCLIPAFIPLYFCICSLPAFMPHAFSLVSDVVHFQFIHGFSCPLSHFLFCCSSLSAFCFIILGSGVSVDTSTPIRASINLQQCLTCVCVCVCACQC